MLTLIHDQAGETLMGDVKARDLEFDLQALSRRLRDDRSFAEELYCALSNVDWNHGDGSHKAMSWRYAAGLVANLRGCGEDYMDFYCTRACEEGTISARVSTALADLGWAGTAHGSKAIYSIDPRSGTQTVWVEGDWVDIAQGRLSHPELFSGVPGREAEPVDQSTAATSSRPRPA